MSDVKPIHSEQDYEAAMAEIDSLWGAKIGTPNGDRLDVLATLVEAYEEKHFSIDLPSPIDAIKARLDQLGLTRKDLEGILGSRSRVSEVLSGQRALSLSMIRRLIADLGIPAEVLIQPIVVGKKRRGSPKLTGAKEALSTAKVGRRLKASVRPDRILAASARSASERKQKV